MWYWCDPLAQTGDGMCRGAGEKSKWGDVGTEELRVPAHPQQTSALPPHLGQGPRSWTGREEETWPRGREGAGKGKPSHARLLTDGPGIAGARFPRERAHSMDIDRKTHPKRPSLPAGARSSCSPPSPGSQHLPIPCSIPSLRTAPSLPPARPGVQLKVVKGI